MSDFNIRRAVVAASALIATLVCPIGEAIVVDGTLYRTGGAAVGSVWNFGVGGSNVETTVDHIPFVVNSAGSVTFDVLSWEGGVNGVHDVFIGPPIIPDGPPTDLNGDSEFAWLDTFIHLFADDGSLDVGDFVALNDDSPRSPSPFIGGADGSIAVQDSLLTMFLVPGQYILAVGSFDTDVLEAVAGSSSTSSGPATWNGSATVVGDHGDYRVTITGDVSLVPEPATLLLLGFGLVGLGVARRRR